MSGRDHTAAGADSTVLPLRDRMPDYLAIFGVGLLAAAALGGLIGGLSAAPLASAVGYSIIGLGVVLLLAGGSAGGGYTNIAVGAIGTLFGGRGRIDEDVDDPDVRRGGLPKTDPMERLRKGLRPEANPRAFWQVIGGFAYIALGVIVVEYLG